MNMEFTKKSKSLILLQNLVVVMSQTVEKDFSRLKVTKIITDRNYDRPNVYR